MANQLAAHSDKLRRGSPFYGEVPDALDVPPQIKGAAAAALRRARPGINTASRLRRRLKAARGAARDPHLSGTDHRLPQRHRGRTLQNKEAAELACSVRWASKDALSEIASSFPPAAAPRWRKSQCRNTRCREARHSRHMAARGSERPGVGLAQGSGTSASSKPKSGQGGYSSRSAAAPRARRHSRQRGAPCSPIGGQNAHRARRSENARGEVWKLPEDSGYTHLNTAIFDRAGIHWFTGQSGIYGRLDPRSGE